jgi:hypothetical protein
MRTAKPSAAKSRGVTLGNPKLHEARKSAVEAVKTEADRYAANMLPEGGRAHPQGNCGSAEHQRDRDGTRRTMVRAIGREHP